MFGKHISCNPSFCKYVSQDSEVHVHIDDDDMEVDENVAATSSQSEKQKPTTLVCHLSQIVAEETGEESLLEGKKETCSGYSRPLSQLLDGLLCLGGRSPEAYGSHRVCVLVILRDSCWRFLCDR